MSRVFVGNANEALADEGISPDARCLVVAGVKMAKRPNGLVVRRIRSIQFAEFCRFENLAATMNRAMEATDAASASAYFIDEPQLLSRLCHLGSLAMMDAESLGAARLKPRAKRKREMAGR